MAQKAPDCGYTATHSTALLLSAVNSGDDHARELLFSRCLPLLRNWARGRLPAYARDGADTEDLVQITLIRALNNLQRFQSSRSGSFLAYLRSILLNTVKEELRRSARCDRRKQRFENELAPPEDDVINTAISSEMIERYEQALECLSTAARDAVILRIEFGMSYPEIAEEVGANSANAARMMVTRGLLKLSQEMS